MTSSIIDTFTTVIPETIKVELLEKILLKSSTYTIKYDYRTVMSSRVEGYAILRYSPQQPSFYETSTQS